MIRARGELGLQMNEAERRRISEFIEQEFGIKMPAPKKSLLEGRLSKRVTACGLRSFGAYFDFVTTDPRGQDEFLRFADLVSTHETSFFREASHFDYLAHKALPTLVARKEARTLAMLSAACSTGEEAYTLAMVVDAELERLNKPGTDFTIEGIDLSDRAVAIAARGVYLAERTKTIPAALKTRYLMHSKDPRANLCRFVPELRARMSFHTGNLLSAPGFAQASYDVIFCRNVLIYFDPANQRKVILTLLNRLKPEGLLFLGHSETMVSLELPVRSVAHAVYQRT